MAYRRFQCACVTVRLVLLDFGFNMKLLETASTRAPGCGHWHVGGTQAPSPSRGWGLGRPPARLQSLSWVAFRPPVRGRTSLKSRVTWLRAAGHARARGRPRSPRGRRAGGRALRLRVVPPAWGTPRLCRRPAWRVGRIAGPSGCRHTLAGLRVTVTSPLASELR